MWEGVRSSAMVKLRTQQMFLMGRKPGRLLRKGSEQSHRREEENLKFFSKKAQICCSFGNEQ